MPRRSKNSNPFAKKDKKASSSSSSKSTKKKPASSSAAADDANDDPNDLLLSAKPHLKTYKIFEEPEDPTLREAREANDNAAMVLQRSWSRRPKWPAAWAKRRVAAFHGGLDGRRLSHTARQRIAALGIHVSASLIVSPARSKGVNPINHHSLIIPSIISSIIILV